MANTETSDTDSIWSLNLIYNSAKKKLEEKNFKEAKKYCIHGQIESLNKNNKYWGNIFDQLYIDIEQTYESLNKQKSNNNFTEETLINEEILAVPENIDGNTNLTSINGVGINTAKKLNKYGIYTIEQLADFTPNKLSKLNGFGINSAKKVIEGAKSLLKPSTKKTKFLSIQKFAEDPPKVNKSIMIEEVDSVLLPNFDRLNEQINLDQGDFTEEEVKHDINNEETYEFSKNMKKKIPKEEIENNNNVKDDLFEEFEEKAIKQDNFEFNAEISPKDEDLYTKYFGEEGDIYDLQNRQEQEEIKNEQLDNAHINNLMKITEKKLKLSGYHIISKGINQQISSIFKNIDIIALKIIEINENLNHIVVFPIKICNLKGILIISEEDFNYKPFQLKLELNYKEKELLINSNIHHLQSANEKIFYNITNEGVLFQFLRKYLKKEIFIEKTRSNKRLFFRSGQLQYKIIIEPILICENEVGFLEKSVIFPYIKRYNLHVTKLAQFLELLDFIETKYELINNYSERSNSVKSYFNSRYKLINDLRLYSVPFIIYGFIFLLTIIFKADILINALIFLTIGSILVYILLLFYIFLRYYKERNRIIEEFSIPEYQLPIRIDETDLLIIKNELSPELLEQLIFECFSKEYNLKVVTEFDHIKSNMESSERNHQNKHEDHEMNSNEIYIEEKFQSKGEKNQIFSKYMSLLED